MCLDLLQSPVMSTSGFNWQSVLRFRMEINTVLHTRPESAGETITSDSSMYALACWTEFLPDLIIRKMSRLYSCDSVYLMA